MTLRTGFKLMKTDRISLLFASGIGTHPHLNSYLTLRVCSMGGALAQICARHLAQLMLIDRNGIKKKRYPKQKLCVVSFGSPCVGNEVRWLSSCLSRLLFLSHSE